MYICNDQAVEICVPYKEIASVGWVAAGQQCLNSAQIFSDSYGGYNVVLGYGNCNHDASTRPSTYGADGPNGPPPAPCGGNAENPCEGTSSACVAGSIVVDGEDSVVCNE